MKKKSSRTIKEQKELPQLLLGADLAAVTALLLAAVVCLEGKPRVAATADHLLAVVLASEGDKRGFKNHL